jgi:predicted phage-related endonuclease
MIDDVPTTSSNSLSRPESIGSQDRRSNIGGSDARVIMSTDTAAVVRLWREKRGEVEPKDLSRDLLVQFGHVTEELNRRCFAWQTGHELDHIQRFVWHPKIDWMGATLDGVVAAERAVFEAKFMLPWSFSEEGAADKHMAQLQHNMLVSSTRRAYLSILTGGAKWVLIEVEADPLYQTVLLQAERLFWRCVQTGEVPRPFAVEPPRAKVPLVRIVDMAASNAWAEHAAVFVRTRAAHAAHEAAKADLKALMPEEAKEAFGHGVRAKRSKAGAISFDVIANGGEHAHLQ